MLQPNATNQAIQRNQELNKTLSALVNESFANLTKAGANIGKDVFEPFARRGLSIINALTSGLIFQNRMIWRKNRIKVY